MDVAVINVSKKPIVTIFFLEDGCSGIIRKPQQETTHSNTVTIGTYVYVLVKLLYMT
jgi:UTP-glucose-1-phosphate uridylyltransferase